MSLYITFDAKITDANEPNRYIMLQKPIPPIQQPVHGISGLSAETIKLRLAVPLDRNVLADKVNSSAADEI